MASRLKPQHYLSMNIPLGISGIAAYKHLTWFPSA